MKQWLLILIFGFAQYFSVAQKITIKNVSLLPLDNAATLHPCLDENGDTCALLKIKTDIDGFKFTNANQYVKANYEAGYYHVYLPSISRKIDISHEDYLPIQIDLADYGYRKLKKGKVYLVVLNTPQINDAKGSLIFKIIPSSANLMLDGDSLSLSANGLYELSIPTGTHNYSISLTNYETDNGTVHIGKAEVKTITIYLKPIIHNVNINCNVKKAHIYVDNVEYGSVGTVSLPQGKHSLRIQADGYFDQEREYQIDSNVKSIDFQLEENKRITHVHATPVTIHSKSNAIYKNNKKIKEWYDGATIMFMPGSYILSTDSGKGKKITVDSEPMEITL